jgi:lysyl-tRNA synthetase, class II
VSLNFAGCAHLVAALGRRGLRQRVACPLLRLVHERFQLERLVRFNEKFFPAWRPRYLLCTGRLQLPRAALRVLQAEGYVRPPARRQLTAAWRPRPRAAGQPMPAQTARSASARAAITPLV